MSPSTAHLNLNLVQTLPIPSSRPNSTFRATRWSPTHPNTAWSVLNTTGGSAKDRRAWVVRWDIVGLSVEEKDGAKAEWKVARMSKAATRPITVFDVR